MQSPSSLPMQTRAAPISTVDIGARTVEVVFTTGATVRRLRWVGWDGDAIPFDEVLIVSREAVNLDRLNSGAPALDSHSTWTTYAQVGVVENARIDAGKGLAVVRFPSKGADPAADRMFTLVAEGIIRNVSVGYVIDELRIEPADRPGAVEKRIVTRWTPHEISFVTVNADPDAQTRAEKSAAFLLTIDRREDFSHAAAARMRMRVRQRALFD
jgi:phage head maturation protease